MEQLTEPLVSVVPLQVCAEPPVPSVRVTLLPESGLPKTVSWPDKVADCPSVAVVAPV